MSCCSTAFSSSVHSFPSFSFSFSLLSLCLPAMRACSAAKAARRELGIAGNDWEWAQQITNNKRDKKRKKKSRNKIRRKQKNKNHIFSFFNFLSFFLLLLSHMRRRQRRGPRRRVSALAAARVAFGARAQKLEHVLHATTRTVRARQREKVMDKSL